MPHAVTCRALGVSESWFYKWHDRAPTARQRRRAALCERVRALFKASGGTYGSPRVHQDLVAEGWTVSVNTVAAVMAELGLSGRKPPKRRSSTKQGKRPVARDLVRRNFDAVAPDVLWCGDMTEIVTGGGRLWCASVIDLFSRRLLGYALSEHHDAQLVAAALQMAVATRGGDVGGVIFHSDRGSEYTSALFNDLCARLGVVQSMGRVGSALDNAVSESFNSVLKVEFVHRHSFTRRGSHPHRDLDQRLLQHAPPPQRGRRPATSRVRASHEGTAEHQRSSSGPSRLTEPSTVPGDRQCTGSPTGSRGPGIGGALDSSTGDEVSCSDPGCSLLDALQACGLETLRIRHGELGCGREDPLKLRTSYWGLRRTLIWW